LIVFEQSRCHLEEIGIALYIVNQTGACCRTGEKQEGRQRKNNKKEINKNKKKNKTEDNKSTNKKK